MIWHCKIILSKFYICKVDSLSSQMISTGLRYVLSQIACTNLFHHPSFWSSLNLFFFWNFICYVSLIWKISTLKRITVVSKFLPKPFKVSACNFHGRCKLNYCTSLRLLPWLCFVAKELLYFLLSEKYIKKCCVRKMSFLLVRFVKRIEYTIFC